MKIIKPALVKKAIISCTISFFITAVFANSTTLPVQLDKQGNASSANAMPLIPSAPNLSTHGYALMDANTGEILAQSNMDQRMEPASLTKMMTLYVTFQALRSGQIHLDDKVRISDKAWHMSGSRMFLRDGAEVTVEQLIQGIIVASGNDACVALAEYIGGTENTFAELMNQAAAQLGMKNTSYVDSTGLPNKNHYSTPHDMAILARALTQDFPAYYHYFSEKWIKYNNIKQPNRNRLLWRDPSVDGLKTGHTQSAGFCLVASGVRDHMRLIAVVMGAPTDSARANDTEALLNYGFRFYKSYKLFSAGQTIATPRTWLAKDKTTALGVDHTIYITVPLSEYKNVKASITINGQLKAPISQGKKYGEISVTLRNKVIASQDLVALQNNPKGGLFGQLIDHVAMLIKKG